MLLIDDKVVSFDVVEKFFCCDLAKCLGQCCVEGDAGAPLLPEEVNKLKEALPVVWNDLTPAAQKVIKEEGVACRDCDGELVTTIVNGRDCVFTTYAPGGLCLCALEKAHRDGKLKFCKPQSCALYPIRLTRYASFTALNYHRWKICRPAEKDGAAKGIRVYEALREPLVRYFGKEWYDKLALTAWQYLKQNPYHKNNS